MRNLEQTVDAIARELGLDDREVTVRKAFLELTEADVALLRAAHGLLQKRKDSFAESFYNHLSAFDALRTLLPDLDTIERLKRSQTEYFSALTAGNYGESYIRDRVRVGVVHQHIGLEPKWYIGAYRKYLSDLMPLLWQLLDEQPDRFLATYGAILKVVIMDMGLALDTYFHADRQVIMQHRNYAEQIINSMPAGLIVVDTRSHVRSMNRAMCELLDMASTTVRPGTDLQAIIPNAALQREVEQVLRTGTERRNFVITAEVNGKGDRHLEFNISRTALGDENLLLLIAQDITDRLQARAHLQESEERFRLTFSQAAVGLAHVAPDGRLQRVNQKLQDILGYTEDELHQLTFQQITHPEDLDKDLELMRGMLAGELRDYAREKRYLHKNGHHVWANITVSSMDDGTGRFKFISVVEDISQRKRVESELLHLASHDALTNLPNRVLLQDRLSQAIIHAARARRFVAVMFIDLDRFKNINDSLGHDAGDRVIAEIGNRLAASVRSGDTVARQGGDEFVVVLSDVSRQGDVEIVAEKILGALSRPLMLQGQELFPAGSIGISVYPRDGGDSQTLLKNADTAMYRAKDAGGNNFQFYVSEMGASTLDHLKLEGGLRRALERKEFVLHYQPQIDIGSGTVVGVEALLRWKPEGRDMISPADFIPIAEETGLIVPIGEWVLRQACAQHKAWQDAGLPHVRIGVNLSARQFRQQDIAMLVSRALRETGCDASCLALEITETAVMERPESAAETLRQLSAMGVQLAIDDFGTGYSSLSYLKRFPIHALKIDRSFVLDITRDADDEAIVRSVIALAHSMKLDVIAEGVETVEQLDFLRDRGCDLMQGYYFSEPVAADEIARLLSSGTTYGRPLEPQSLSRTNS